MSADRVPSTCCWRPWICPTGSRWRRLAEAGIDRQQLHDTIRAQHAAALRSVGVEVDDAAIDRLIPPPVAPAGVYRSQGSMQDLFQRSAVLAKAAGRPVLSGDVLMAALDAEQGTVARTLVEVAIDRTTLRQSLASLLGSA